MVRYIDINKGVRCYHHIVSYVDIAYYCSIGTNTHSISNHWCPLSLTCCISANRHSMRNINLITKLYISVYNNSSVMPDNKPFPKIGIVFYMNTCHTFYTIQFIAIIYPDNIISVCLKSPICHYKFPFRLPPKTCGHFFTTKAKGFIKALIYCNDGFYFFKLNGS